MKKILTCTVCPTGCLIEAEWTTKEDIVVKGNGCKRGLAYCTDECFAPKRTFTSSVRISGTGRRMLPVRTDIAVPKELLFSCAEATHKMKLEAPVKAGDILAEDFLGTGAKLISSMSLNKEA